ncbi:MAG: hypothetical protein J6L90_03130 [Clostridia bacterium]|nr:hypothetical protein [Clostridia bacterium]
MSEKRDLSCLTPGAGTAEIQVKLGVSYTEAKAIKASLEGTQPIMRLRSPEALADMALDYELVAIKSTLSPDAVRYIKNVMEGLTVDTERSYELDLLRSFGIATLDGRGKVRLLWDLDRVNALIKGSPDPAVTEVARICMELCYRTMSLTVPELVKDLTSISTIPQELIALVRVYRDYREENQRRGVPMCLRTLAGGNIHMMLLKSLGDRIHTFNKTDIMLRLMADYTKLGSMELSDSELFLCHRELINIVSSSTEEALRQRLKEYTDRLA